MARHNRFALSPILNDDDSETQSGADAPFLDRELLQSRTLLVFGPIDDKLARHCATRLLVMEGQDRDELITVLINSPGGSADSGFALYDMLRFVTAPVRTVVNGLCASAGILVHLAGDEGMRYCLPQSRFMIHQPSTAGQGTASDLDITAQEVIKLRARYVGLIADATGNDSERVLERSRRDFWLNAEEALEYGLVSKIVATRTELDG